MSSSAGKLPQDDYEDDDCHFQGWDRELAQLAQRLADQCMFVHDECRATVRYPHAGQSVGEVRVRKSVDRSGLDAMTLKAVRRVLDAWWAEKRRVEPKHLFQPFRMNPKGAVWGHFSQLAVWSLRAVGCGAVRHAAARPRLLLVCDFSHTNMLGERTLNPGPLAACPQNTARRSHTAFSQLCAARPTENEHTHRYKNEDYDDGEMARETTPKPSARTRTQMRTKERKTATEPYFESSGAEDFGQHIERERDSGMTASNEDRREGQERTTGLGTKLTVSEKEDSYIDGGPVEDERSDTSGLRSKTFEKMRSGQYDMEAFRRGRKMFEEFGQIPRLKSNSRYSTPEPPVTKRRSTVEHSLTEERPVRKKWKQASYRPKRPGAAALFTRPHGRFYSRTARVSLMLDKDDHEQFFKDTGFSITAADKVAVERKT